MSRKKVHVINTAEHSRHPSVEVKLNALHRCFELGEDIGYSSASIYKWRKKYLWKGTTAFMNSEELFGRLKNEMFYNRDWTSVGINSFINILNDYLIWYTNERIKVSLGNMSPSEYRQSLGLAA